MTATNHVTTGAVFAALTVGALPIWVILPAAFLLHFVLDSLPHFGDPAHPDVALHRLRWFLPLDAFVALLVLGLIFALQPEYWFVIMTAGVLCASPDLWSIARYVRFLKRGDTAISPDWFARFHHRIQREYPWGIWLELLWFGVMLSLLWQNIR